MGAQNTLGKEGEELAVAYFIKMGYSILHTNWKFAQHEIDLIAMKENCLHFIEVKSRSTKRFGFPEEKVTRKKILFLFKAADAFLYMHPDYKIIQFDILSVNKHESGKVEYFLIEDVYV